ncbi:MAG: pilus assembly protein [Chloroflexi bacterium]|nr:MAG: pilus assembly protein [Chloroflexota bacterium]
MSRARADHRRKRSQRSGQSMVEFALVGPLVLVLLFGMIDFGRAIFFQVELNNAAREGVRIAILASNPCNTSVGNSTCNPDNNNQSGFTGSSVCQGIEQETNLIGTWNQCTDGTGSGSGSLPCSAGPPVSCSGTANQGYVEINQATTNQGTNPTCSNTVVTSSATNWRIGVPRIGGNLPVQVKIIYFYRPVTPILSKLFPANFYLYTSSCGRPEY